jgi:hypothetical protein
MGIPFGKTDACGQPPQQEPLHNQGDRIMKRRFHLEELEPRDTPGSLATGLEVGPAPFRMLLDTPTRVVPGGILQVPPGFHIEPAAGIGEHKDGGRVDRAPGHGDLPGFRPALVIQNSYIQEIVARGV